MTTQEEITRLDRTSPTSLDACRATLLVALSHLKQAEILDTKLKDPYWTDRTDKDLFDSDGSVWSWLLLENARAFCAQSFAAHEKALAATIQSRKNGMN